MLDKAKLFSRLQSGETMNQILEELTQDLNTVEKEYQESEAKRIEEETRAAAKKKEAERIYAAKSAAVDHMLDAICDYLMVAEAFDMLEEVHEADTDAIIEMLDGSINFVRTLEAMKNLEFQKEDKKNDIVGHFFNLLG